MSSVRGPFREAKNPVPTITIGITPFSLHHPQTTAISGKTDAAFGNFKELMCVFH
jgi:hypothetical protein